MFYCQYRDPKSIKALDLLVMGAATKKSFTTNLKVNVKELIKDNIEYVIYNT